MSTRRRTTTTTTTTRIAVSSDRGVFMISVAAELADMHPQTLRMYEQRGLIEPKRSAKGTRLYSHEDVERLRRIQRRSGSSGAEPGLIGEWRLSRAETAQGATHPCCAAAAAASAARMRATVCRGWVMACCQVTRSTR
jgi:hypothetical protein